MPQRLRPAPPKGDDRARAAGLLAPGLRPWFTEGFDTAGLKEAKALLD